VALTPEQLERRRRNQEKRRVETLRAISGPGGLRCECCGEDRVWSLTFDHRDGGGNEHRRAHGNAATVVLVRRDHKRLGRWPIETYAVLCATCNHGRRVSRDGRCPHEREREEVNQ